nr:hypothetical protein [Tanacetum cinerariifolium]
MAPKRTTKSSPATTTTTTTSVTDAQLKALINQGVTRALATRDADRNTNEDDNHVSGTGARRTKRVTRECTYPDFMNNCSVENQIKFSTCTLLGSALTWWNSHVMIVGPDAAYTMTWVDIKKKITDKYCSRGEMKKLESELWNLRVKSNDVAENKRKDDNNNQAQQQPLKKQGVAIAYTAGPGKRKEYAGTLLLCNKCKFHHNGQCIIKCVNCKRVGHLIRDCRSHAATNNHRNPTCYECKNQGHYRSDCPELKNQDHGNQAGGTGAHGMVQALEGGETNQDLNDVEDDINA